METRLINREWTGKQLIDAIASLFDISKKKAKDHLDRKRVLLNGKRVWIAKYLVHAGDTIELLDAEKVGKKPVRSDTFEDLHILFEDDFLIVINKPAGILTNGEKSFEEVVQKKYKNKAIKAVHRLDRDTSGALIFSKSKNIFDEFVKIFKEGRIDKKYAAVILCQSTLAKGAKFIIDSPLEGKTAYTEVVIKEVKPPIYFAEIEIKTGRTHQIRKHLVTRGMQVLGDNQYEISIGKTSQFRSIPRQLLHASYLFFPHPVTGKKIEIHVPLPEEFTIEDGARF